MSTKKRYKNLPILIFISIVLIALIVLLRVQSPLKNLKDSSAAITGTNKVAVVLLNWATPPANSTALPTTTAAESVMNQVEQFMSENSYGKFQLVNTTSDIFRMNMDVSYSCLNFVNFNSGNYTNDPVSGYVNSHYSSVGLVPANYKQVVFVLPLNHSDCGYSGLTPTSLWYGALMTKIDSQNYDLKTVAHEMGHNYGSRHSSSWNCSSTAIPSGCTLYSSTAQYDLYEPMGNNFYGIHHFGVSRKEKFGWFNSSNVRNINASGTYTIYPIESNLPTSLQAIKVCKNATSYYTIENREPIGIDANLIGRSPSVIDGAIIRYIPSGISYDSDSFSLTNNGQAFAYGSTFTDSTNGIQIKVGSAKDASKGLPVTVTYTNGSPTTCPFSVSTPPTNPPIPPVTNLLYCPSSSVTRAQMAVFLIRGKYGYPFIPAPVGTSTGFSDVPTTHWAAPWIKKLVQDGITSGCGTGIYCPSDSVTRAQMAVFLLKLRYGATYSPPAVGTSTGFTDVPTTHWAASFIKKLFQDGITAGCSSTTYCPDSPVTREQMAVFLLRTKYLSPATTSLNIFTDVASTNVFKSYIDGLYNVGMTGGCRVVNNEVTEVPKP